MRRSGDGGARCVLIESGSVVHGSICQEGRGELWAQVNGGVCLSNRRWAAGVAEIMLR